MRIIDPARSILLMIDLQERLLPAMEGQGRIVANVRRLIDAAAIFGVPVFATEQYPKGLGRTVEDLAVDRTRVLEKLEFDAGANSGFARLVPPERPDVVIVGCEAHVCVLQTALGLVDGKRRVHVVADAVGSRRATDRDAALERMRGHGIEIVTGEMVVFEWLRTAAHPRFREVSALVR